jgi:uncharacterized circularly permuted ATP-grasp superfamily protein
MARDNGNSIETYRKQLRIDTTDLEGALVDQVELFDNVSSERVKAVGRRDRIKLDIEELTVKLDKDIRARAEKDDKKTTETSIANAIKDDPDVRGLKEDHLAFTTEAEHWLALEEGVRQRGYALRELVQIDLRRMTIEGDVRQSERTANDYKYKKEEARQAGVVRARKKLGKK